MVERSFSIREVPGSIPGSSTFFLLLLTLFCRQNIRISYHSFCDIPYFLFSLLSHRYASVSGP